MKLIKLFPLFLLLSLNGFSNVENSTIEEQRRAKRLEYQRKVNQSLNADALKKALMDSLGDTSVDMDKAFETEPTEQIDVPEEQENNVTRGNYYIGTFTFTGFEDESIPDYTVTINENHISVVDGNGTVYIDLPIELEQEITDEISNQDQFGIVKGSYHFRSLFEVAFLKKAFYDGEHDKVRCNCTFIFSVDDGIQSKLKLEMFSEDKSDTPDKVIELVFSDYLSIDESENRIIAPSYIWNKEKLTSIKKISN